MPTSESKNLPLLNPALREFFRTPSRNKVLYGGRASGKSYAMCAAIVLKAQHRKTLIMCVRRFQSRISESVFSLIANQIEALGYSHRFEILKNEIRCDNGSRIIFKGLEKNQEEIRGTTDIDLCFVEESNSITPDQDQLLQPTIRSENSEVWYAFNPKFSSDYMYDHYVTNTPPDTLVRKINYTDNIYLSATILKVIQNQKAADYELYRHIYLGECATIVKDQVFYQKWREADFEVGDDWDGCYIGLDFGYAQDACAANESWIHDNKLYIRHEMNKKQLEIDATADALKRAIPSATNHVVYCDSARPESISYLQRHGLPRATACKKWAGSIADGIAFMRSFDEIIIHPTCKETILEFMHYRYATDRLSGDILPKPIDKHNHHIDGIRYSLVPIMRNSLGPLIGCVL